MHYVIIKEPLINAELARPDPVVYNLQDTLSYTLTFNIMGRDYDAAVITAGTCGFGMGATPNAIANMQAVCEKYVPSIKAFLIIPIVGSLFVDFMNSLVITFFINAI